VTPGEVSRLLAACAMFDFRTVEEPDAEAWHLVIGDLDYEEAMEAVRRHYADSTDRMMPAHIRQGVKALRQARRRQEPHPIRELPSRFERDMGEQVRVARGAATVRDVLGPVLEHIARQSAGQPAAVSAIDQLRAITAGPGWDTDTIDGEVIE
jgi:hypothetical protein